MSASPPPPQHPPTLPISTTAASRRLPPPCWSHDETVALIDAYRDKWYSLRRGNLRANHWQEVADCVAVRCPLPAGNPPKTSVQCRHKMEKLRKRYRAELQRSLTNPNPKGHKYCSSWVHFNRMDSMEKGPNHINRDEDEEDDENQEDYQENLYDSRLLKPKISASPIHNPNPNYRIGGGISNGNGFRIRFPGQSSTDPGPQAKVYGKFDESFSPSSSPSFGCGKVFKGGSSGGKSGHGKKREGGAMAEMVAGIKSLGDGFVRIERMKMEMAREVEAIRMDMEMKRTQIILESQQMIVEAFAKGLTERENKKARRMPTPES
ncbi:hypothetical protein LguiA_010202 [Lonicera macranthoides]